MSRLCLLFCCSLALSGCIFPSVRATRNPQPHDKGIRYYRPKPYLLISALRSEKDNEGPATDQMVKLELQYLPDFSEEYSLCVTPGLGTANVGIKLDQGWNLVEINQDLDSNVDDNLRAVGSLAGDLASAVTATKGATTPPDTPSMVVQATNVPLGFYESVIGPGAHGQKQLFGWRYVGFAPFNACPTTIMGGTRVCCDAPDAAIYGLVFENGVMVFKPLPEIQVDGDVTRVPVRRSPANEDTPTGAESIAPPATFKASTTLEAMKTFITGHRGMRQLLGTYTVTVEPSWNQLNTIQATVQAKPVDEATQQAVRDAILDEPELMELLREISPTAVLDLRFTATTPAKKQ